MIAREPLNRSQVQPRPIAEVCAAGDLGHAFSATQDAG
jgi:hypothetical protein